MRRFKSQSELGLRWLNCGRRLYLRNPSLLVGMGFCVALIVSLFSFVPLMGGPLLALLAPFLLGGVYLTIDTLVRQKVLKPSAQAKASFRQAPRELIGVLRDERRLVPAVVAGFYALFVALVANTLGGMIAGRGWDAVVGGLSMLEAARLTAAMLVSLFINFWLAASLVYALPLTFFHKEPLIPAIVRSFKTGWRYPYALAVVLSLLLVPAVVGRIVASFDVPLAYVATFIAAGIVLPLVATSLYCSYRTIFQVAEAARQPVRAPQPAGGLRWGSNTPKRR